MANVLECDCTAGDAYVRKVISFPSTWYAQLDVAIPAATFAAIRLHASGGDYITAPYLYIMDGSGNTTAQVFSGDASGTSGGLTSPTAVCGQQFGVDQPSIFTEDTWHTVQFHYDGSTVHVTIDGVNYDANLGGPLTNGSPAQLRVGGPFAHFIGAFANHIYYIDNVKVGTTLGATDLFGDDFEGGSLASWTATVGSASIVADPGFPTGGGGGGGLTGSPYTGYAPSFAVANMAHDGTVSSTIVPVGNSLEWTYRLAQVGGPGDAQWEVALSDSALTTDDFAPKRTDWKLVMDGVNDLCAGIVTSVNLVSESDSGVFGVVRCQGLDWLHYLEQPYGFDYADVASDQPTNQLSDHDRLWRIFTTTASGGVAGVTYSATQQDVVDDLIASLSGYVDAVAFTQSYNGSGWTEGVNMNIGFGDDSTVLDLILGLARLDSPYGFDIFVRPDKTIEGYAPRRVDPSSVTPLYTLNDSSIVSPPLDWTNNGPNASDTVMLGTGLGNTRSVGFSTYGPTQSTYRQWVRIGEVDFPDNVSAGHAADGAGYWDRFPHKDLKLTIRPDLLDATDARLGFTNLLGEAITVDYNVTPYHHIDADFWITEQHYYSPDGCNWLADFTLSQIYTTAATPTP